jgi:hypothetical protein
MGAISDIHLTIILIQSRILQVKVKEVAKCVADETGLNPKEAEVTAARIKHVNIRFTASEALKETLKKATFTAIESLSR